MAEEFNEFEADDELADVGIGGKNHESGVPGSNAELGVNVPAGKLNVEKSVVGVISDGEKRLWALVLPCALNEAGSATMRTGGLSFSFSFLSEPRIWPADGVRLACAELGGECSECSGDRM